MRPLVGLGQPVQTSVAVATAGRATGRTAAVANVVQVTVGDSDASYAVSANVKGLSGTAWSFTVTCAYTDENGNTPTLTFTFGIGSLLTTSVALANGLGPYQGLTYHLRCKARTTITIATTGTFTDITYNVEGRIGVI